MPIGLIPRGVEEAQFQRVPEGWVFTTSNIWGVGPRQSYMLTEAQKPAIAASVRYGRRLRVFVLLAMMPVLIVVLWNVPSLRHPQTFTAWLALGALIAVLTVAIAACDRFAVGPLLRDLPRTQRTVRWAEMLRNQSQAMSLRALTVLALACAIVAVTNTLIWAKTANPNALMGLSALFEGMLALFFLGMLAMKLSGR